MEHDLGDAVAVAQVDEDDAAQVAPPVHPSHEDGVPARVRRAQFAAGVGPPKVAEEIEWYGIRHFS